MNYDMDTNTHTHIIIKGLPVLHMHAVLTPATSGFDPTPLCVLYNKKWVVTSTHYNVLSVEVYVDFGHQACFNEAIKGHFYKGSRHKNKPDQILILVTDVSKVGMPLAYISRVRFHAQLVTMY